MKLLENYKDKTILITGHTGFKGSWLSAWLLSLGAKVVGISIDIPTDPSNFQALNLSKFITDHRVDVLDFDLLKKVVHEVKPDFIFHMAAQPLVRPSYLDPLETMKINSIGSANLLEAVRIIDKKVIVLMITSDKAYDNVEWLWGYRETDRLGGKDPYSASKAMAEMVVRSYVESFFDSSESKIRVGIVRAGNVIGGGDWAQDRIVPDCMSAWTKNEVVNIRNPNSTRPWQHVLEPLSGYLLLGVDLFENNKNHGEAYNFGPPGSQNHSVSELIDEMSKYWNQIQWKDVSAGNHAHEAGLLKLNCDKAQYNLNWQPTLNFTETVKMTVEWYKYYYQNKGNSMYDFTISQILEYTRLSNTRKLDVKND